MVQTHQSHSATVDGVTQAVFLSVAESPHCSTAVSHCLPLTHVRTGLCSRLHRHMLPFYVDAYKKPYTTPLPFPPLPRCCSAAAVSTD